MYDIIKRYVDSGNEELYQEKVLVIDSNMDSVVDGWSIDVENDVLLDARLLIESKKEHFSETGKMGESDIQLLMKMYFQDID